MGWRQMAHIMLSLAIGAGADRPSDTVAEMFQFAKIAANVQIISQVRNNTQCVSDEREQCAPPCTTHDMFSNCFRADLENTSKTSRKHGP
jgi:hypothetical protein